SGSRPRLSSPSGPSRPPPGGGPWLRRCRRERSGPRRGPSRCGPVPASRSGAPPPPGRGGGPRVQGPRVSARRPRGPARPRLRFPESSGGRRPRRPPPALRGPPCTRRGGSGSGPDGCAPATAPPRRPKRRSSRGRRAPPRTGRGTPRSPPGSLPAGPSADAQQRRLEVARARTLGERGSDLREARLRRLDVARLDPMVGLLQSVGSEEPVLRRPAVGLPSRALPEPPQEELLHQVVDQISVV